MFAYFDFVHLEVWPHLGLCQLFVLSTLDSAHFWFCLLGSLSTWVFFYLESVHLGVWPHDILPQRIVSIIRSLNSEFCSLLVLSTFGAGHLGVCLLGFCTLGNLCTCYSVNWGLCQELVVFTLDSAPSWFCLLLIMSIQDFFNLNHVYLALCPLGSLSTWTLSTSQSGHMTFCPCRIVSTIGSVNSCLCSLLDPSTWESLHLGLYLLWFCSLGSRSTWHSAHVG